MVLVKKRMKTIVMMIMKDKGESDGYDNSENVWL